MNVTRPRALVGSLVAVLGLALSAVLAPASSAAALPTALPRVVNGAPGNPGTYGYLVALLEPTALHARGPFSAQFCGGTLTTPSTVVTAAHCVVDQDNGRIKSPNEVVIANGSSLEVNQLATSAVSAIAVHPSYDIDTATNDVAVLTLAQPFAGAPTIAPVDPSLADRALLAGVHAFVVGWGNTVPGGNSYPRLFRVGELIVMPPETCGRGLDYAIGDTLFTGFGRNDANPASMLCASGITPAGDIIDACQGDSGGPLVATLEGQERLIGIVSWGTDCATSNPGVYTRVARMYDFLSAAGALAGTAPTLAPALTVDPLPGALRVNFSAPPAGGNVTAFAATALDPATGKAINCVAAPTGEGASGSCVIIGLVDGTSYQISAVSGNPLGQSPVSDPVTAVPAPVPTPGRIKHIDRINAGRIQVWSTPSDGSGLEITSEVIVCTPVKGGADRIAAVVAGVAMVRGLKKVAYACQLHVTNSAGTTVSNSIVIKPGSKGTSHLKPGGIQPKP